MHPLKPYFQGDRGAAAPPAHHLPEVLPHAGHRGRRHDHAAPHVLRDARQLLARRLLQGGRGRSSRGSSRSRASASSPRTSGSRSSRATRSSASAPTRRRSRRGSRSASRASGSCPARARRTSGRPARPGPAARARSSTSTAAWSGASPTTCPGGDNERFLEYWNLVFMQYDQDPVGTLTPLPKQNIDTGLGLNRMALIQQGTDSIFETDQFLPLIRLGEELSGRRYDAGDFDTDRALRILADHTRGMSFLVADGVVPSNEDRGYVLRRIMRRALLQGRRIGIEDAFLTRFSGGRPRADGGPPTPSCTRRRRPSTCGSPARSSSSARRSSRARGSSTSTIARARDAGDEGIGAEQAFQLHDTYGFPFELTVELAAEQGLGVDAAGLRGPDGASSARARGRAPGRGGRDADRERVRAFAEAAGAHTDVHGLRAARAGDRGRRGRRVRTAACWRSSSSRPFYATGGGQIADVGVVECESGDCRARVVDVVRLGDDQALVLEPEQRRAARGRARDRARRPRAPPPDGVQPHRDPPAARGAARARRRPRAPGGLLRRARTSCASTSPTPSRSRPRRCATSRTASTAGSSRTTRCARSRPRSRRPRRSARPRCSARSTATSSAWSRSGTAPGRASCAAARTSARPPRSASSRSRPRPRAPRTCAASRRSPGPVAVGLLRAHDRVLGEAAATLRTTPENVATAVADREAERRDLAKQLRAGGVRGAGSSRPTRRPTSPASACSSRARSSPTRRRCPMRRTSCAASSATRRSSCSAPRSTAAWRCSSRPARARSSAA